MAPWILLAFAEIDINPDREKAKNNALILYTTSDTIIYSDASGHNNHLGVAAVVIDENKQVVESSQVCIGLIAKWPVHAAELIGIYYAINLVYKITSKKQ